MNALRLDIFRINIVRQIPLQEPSFKLEGGFRDQLRSQNRKLQIKTNLFIINQQKYLQLRRKLVLHMIDKPSEKREKTEQFEAQNFKK